MPALRLEIMSRCGAITLRIVMTCRFMPKRVPSCSSVGFFRMALSSSSMASSNSDSTGKNESTSVSMIR
jgi:hypothetical protein